MNDRELLEFAAKAAGYEFTHYSKEMGLWASIYPSGRYAYWNPITDDGDALRLAVKLGLHIEPWFDDEDVREVIVYGVGSHKEPDADDRMAATRRSIVRAAAEIGRAMP